MSRRRSAVATVVVLGAFGWFYVFALAVPISTGDAYAIWTERGQAWFGALVSRLLNGLSFLWGSMVRDEYAAAPETAWPTVLFVVLVAGLTYASLRSGTASPEGAVGRVLGACVLAAGFTNLYLVFLATSTLADEGRVPFSEIAPPGLEGGIWLGIVLGLVGGIAVSIVVAFATLAAVALSARDEADAAESPRMATASLVRATRVATWGVLPLLVLVLVGGFVGLRPRCRPRRDPGAGRNLGPHGLVRSRQVCRAS
jgi:ABC-type antimicrobial peptide transport system permease subunit